MTFLIPLPDNLDIGDRDIFIYRFVFGASLRPSPLRISGDVKGKKERRILSAVLLKQGFTVIIPVRNTGNGMNMKTRWLLIG